MEYVKHKSLRQMLRVNFTGLSLEDKRKLALSLCECVQMLHDADIPLILGKISSNKFLVGEDMRVKMYDLAYCGKPEMAARYLKGKNREYMPSDNIVAIEGSYDEKTECFIVGIILMEIVTCKSPSEAIRSQQVYPDPFHKVIRGLQEPDRSKRMAMKDAARELQKS
ncbi:mixed lineage kinase domain-like protein isoform X2 [Ptychodera flava]